jgi:hypothetical protein
LRFDDRLQTSLLNAADDSFGIATRWRQLIDILSQKPILFSPDDVAGGLRQARQLRDHVPDTERLMAVKSLNNRIRSAPLVQLLAADIAPIAAAAIDGAKLSDAEWADIVPHLPVRARGFLRNRPDLGPKTRKALWIWSSADFVLPDLSSENIQANDTQSIVPNKKTHQSQKISEIVERIERLRKERESTEDTSSSLSEFSVITDHLSPQKIFEIRFETDEIGTVSWIEGAPRGAIVGVGISEPSFDTGPGPDAYGAAAFRQRMPMENARMRLCGAPNIEGDWRINAAPFFDAVSGRFRGYRGLFRRPTVAENPQIESSLAQGDQLQQLVHELRTPLGAIIGFSEIIEQQLFGPVSAEYRTLAASILREAERLLAGFDDLAIAARVESGTFTAKSGLTECDWLASRLAERLQGLSDTLSVTLNLAKADPVRPFAMEHELAERMFSRLLSAVIIGCQPGEELAGRFKTELGKKATNSFTLDLPDQLKDKTEMELLGSVPYDTDSSKNAPLLGLGFSLRLVRNLARNVGGDLRFQKESLLLTIPASRDGYVHLRDEEKE